MNTPPPSGLPLALVRHLRVEGVAVLVASLLVFELSGGRWWVFALLFLIPDLTFLAYLAGPRVGARAYNLAHNYTLPLMATLAGFAFQRDPALDVGLIWLAHIGADRALGFGLKIPGGFKATHLDAAR